MTIENVKDDRGAYSLTAGGSAEDDALPSVHRTRCGFATGLLLIALVSCVYVIASELVETVFHDLSFDKPFFLSYLNTCGFAFWLLTPCCSGKLREELASRHVDSEDGSKEPTSTPWRSYAKVGAVVCPGWLLGLYFFNLSLDNTSVASNSILSTTGNVWTMLFSACILGEGIDPFKVAAVAITVGGAALVALSDEESQGGQQRTAVGDLLSIASAGVYAIYSVVLIYMTTREFGKDLSMSLVFGFVGLFVMLGGWPFLILLHAWDVETFEWPERRILALLSFTGFIGTTLPDVLGAQAMQLTSPLMASLGLSLTIPVGMVSDVVLHGRSFPRAYLGGSLLVLIGFVLGAVAELLWQRCKECLGCSVHSAESNKVSKDDDGLE